jgi:hypothetical protein
MSKQFNTYRVGIESMTETQLLIADALEARALARHGTQLQIAAATSRD